MKKKKQKNKFEMLIESSAWLGTIMIVGSFGLLNLHILTVDDISYQLVNIIGSSFIMIDAYFDKNWQPVFLEIVWIAIAFIGLSNIFVN